MIGAHVRLAELRDKAASILQGRARFKPLLRSEMENFKDWFSEIQEEYDEAWYQPRHTLYTAWRKHEYKKYLEYLSNEFDDDLYY